MNWFDIFILIVVVYCCVSGYKSGLVKQLASLAGIIIGAIISGKISSIVYPHIQNTLQLPDYLAAPLSYTAAFVLILLFFYTIGIMLNTIINSIKMGTLNKLAGVVLCLAKWIILISILVNIIAKADEQEKWLEEKMSTKSFTYQYIQPIAPQIIPYLKFTFDRNN